MRYKFIILFLFISFIGKAQVYQLMPQYGYDAKRMNFDSTIQIPTFCGVPKLASNVTKKGALAFDSCNNRFYFFNPKFQSWDTIKSADATLFVKYTDTSSMLSPYLRKGDTIFLSQRIDKRVKYIDTAAMLTNYVNSVNYAILKLGKTISVDTSVLSTKYLRIVDTANKFVSSVTKLNDSTIRVVKDGTTTDIAISAVSSASRLITQVWNNTGATILRGSVVYISGRHSSNLPTIALAEANNEANSYKTFALVDGDIADNSSGYVIQAGKITGLNLPTSSYTDGDILYLSPTVPGGYTITKPLAPNHIVKLGSVTRAHPTQGSIEIKIENGWQLDELSDVQIAAVPADSTLLQFSRVDSLWHDVSPLTAMGNRFVKTTDSASMLTPYLRSNVAAATYATISQNNLKLNISDTANMLLPYLRKIDTTNRFVTSLFRKTASDSVFFVRGGTNNFAFRDSAGGANIYTTDGSLTSVRALSLNNFPLSIVGNSSNNSSRFHANGNITFGNISAVTNDSTYRLNIMGNASGASNVLSLIMRPSVAGGQRITFSQNNDVYNILHSTTHFIISNSGGIMTLGGGSGQRTVLGCNKDDALTPVTIGYESWRGPSASAILDVRSTTQGFLPPRMTTAQRDAISSPATGLIIYNTTTNKHQGYNGTTWNDFY